VLTDFRVGWKFRFLRVGCCVKYSVLGPGD
jgi:hypothetical protein